MTLPRPSFRQLLLVGFLLVAGLLGALVLRGQVVLEGLLERSGAGAQRAIAINGHAERLGDAAIAMERAARQYVVLGDRTLRQTHDRAAAEADRQLQALAADGVAPDAPAAWRRLRARIDDALDDTATAPAQRDARMALAFRELAALQAQLAVQLRRVTEQRNAALQAELDATRAALGRQFAAAVLLSSLLALALAFALARPLRRVGAAIVALGDNRLDERIDIPGPSDVRQIGRQLDWLRQRLAANDDDKARFLRHVSHELKTPLAALREGVALLQDAVAGPLTPDQREVARILNDNTAALQQRIEDLLRFNATAFAAQRRVRRPTDLAALVRAVIDEQQLQWRVRNLTVELVAPPGPALRADVDAALLSTAIANLVSNAIRYSPTGATIAVELARAGDDVRIDVIDEGPGIAPADRERVFEPFYRGQTQPEGGLAGTGIGLSIVAEAAAAHGGRVRLLDPVAGTRGARFRIELPHALAD